MRRGFKAEAEWYATEFRKELGFQPDGPLDPMSLASHLAVPVLALSHLAELSRQTFGFGDCDEFSAAVVPHGTFKMIVHNDAQHPNRQCSNIMHELAHIILGHPPHPPLTGDRCRNFNRELEQEAKELSSTLLIPKKAALRIVESRITMMQASIIYGASPRLIEYRIKISDAGGWASNRAKKRTG